MPAVFLQYRTVTVIPTSSTTVPAASASLELARITDEDEFEDLQGTKIAVQYAAAYLYEHREEADHHQLVMDLRSLLFGVRKPGF